MHHPLKLVVINNLLCRLNLKGSSCGDFLDGFLCGNVLSMCSFLLEYSLEVATGVYTKGFITWLAHCRWPLGVPPKAFVKSFPTKDSAKERPIHVRARNAQHNPSGGGH